MRTQVVSIDKVIADSRCQSRTGIDLALVHDYAEAIKGGAELPPLSTIDSEHGYYLYDGFHRLEAYRQAGKKNIVIESEPGDVWDAVERSCAVNAIHGKRRTPADVKNAVKKIIEVMHHRGERWNQSEIADKCGITQQRVSQIINSDPSYKDLYDAAAPVTTATRNGKSYDMDTSKIGKHRHRAPDLAAQLAEAEDVDEGTGEILDDAPPPYEEVDPADPAEWFAPAPRTAQSPRAAAPSAPDETATNAAREIIAQYGRTVALEIAGEIRRLA